MACVDVFVFYFEILILIDVESMHVNDLNNATAVEAHFLYIFSSSFNSHANYFSIWL